MGEVVIETQDLTKSYDGVTVVDHLNLIAINKDPEANIFKEASFGVVGDWKKVLPAFTDKVRELLAE